MKKLIVSYTAISDFTEGCKLKSYLKWVALVKPVPGCNGINYELVFGICLHNFMRKSFDKLGFNLKEINKKWKRYWNSVFYKFLNTQKAKFILPSGVEYLYFEDGHVQIGKDLSVKGLREGYSCLSNYCAIVKERGSPKGREITIKSKKASTDFGIKFYLRGTIDEVREAVNKTPKRNYSDEVFIDLKTSKKPATSEDEKSFMLQAAMYSRIQRENTGKTPNFCFLFLKEYGRKGVHNIEVSEGTFEMLDTYIRSFLQFCSSVDPINIEPTDNPLDCLGCVYSVICDGYFKSGLDLDAFLERENLKNTKGKRNLKSPWFK